MAKSPGRPRKSPIFNKPSKYDTGPSYVEAKEPEPNFDLLDEGKKSEILARARANVEARELERAEAAFLEKETARIERETHPEAYEEMKDIEIDVAIYPPVIIIDGKQYWHGWVGKVPKSRYDSMMDMMARARKHYRETQRNPMQVMQENAQTIAKGGPSYATINGSTGQVTKF